MNRAVAHGRTEDDALDRVHQDRVDPWQVESWYKRRKRAFTLSSDAVAAR